MAFIITDNTVGHQAIADTATTARYPLGTTMRAYDPVYGAGEFIYLKGVASTVVGSWVTYAMDDGSTALIVPDVIGPVAVAMSANVANQYGWYQISGKARAQAADVSDNGKVYIDTAAGVCDDAVVAGDKVFNATWASDEDTSGIAEVELSRPFTTDEST